MQEKDAHAPLPSSEATTQRSSAQGLEQRSVTGKAPPVGFRAEGPAGRTFWEWR